MSQSASSPTLHKMDLQYEESPKPLPTIPPEIEEFNNSLNNNNTNNSNFNMSVRHPCSRPTSPLLPKTPAFLLKSPPRNTSQSVSDLIINNIEQTVLPSNTKFNTTTFSNYQRFAKDFDYDWEKQNEALLKYTRSYQTQRHVVRYKPTTERGYAYLHTGKLPDQVKVSEEYECPPGFRSIRSRRKTTRQKSK